MRFSGWIVALALCVLSACGSEPAPPPADIPSEQAETFFRELVTENTESGEEGSTAATLDPWPFDAASVTLNCRYPTGHGSGSITVTTPDGREYAVNGLARRNYPDMRPIWLEDPQVHGLKINIGAAIEAGHALCLGAGQAAPPLRLTRGAARTNSVQAEPRLREPGPPPTPDASHEPPMACEASQNQADRVLMARARRMALRDAEQFSRGQPVRSYESWVSAEAPEIACGRVWFDAESGPLSYAYVNGEVYGRWREIAAADARQPFDASSPFRRVREFCQYEQRTCEIAR